MCPLLKIITGFVQSIHQFNPKEASLPLSLHTITINNFTEESSAAPRPASCVKCQLYAEIRIRVKCMGVQAVALVYIIFIAVMIAEKGRNSRHMGVRVGYV